MPARYQSMYMKIKFQQEKISIVLGGGTCQEESHGYAVNVHGIPLVHGSP